LQHENIGSTDCITDTTQLVCVNYTLTTPSLNKISIYLSYSKNFNHLLFHLYSISNPNMSTLCYFRNLWRIRDSPSSLFWSPAISIITSYRAVIYTRTNLKLVYSKRTYASPSKSAKFWIQPLFWTVTLTTLDVALFVQHSTDLFNQKSSRYFLQQFRIRYFLQQFRIHTILRW